MRSGFGYTFEGAAARKSNDTNLVPRHVRSFGGENPPEHQRRSG